MAQSLIKVTSLVFIFYTCMYCLHFLLAGMEVPADQKEQMTFSSSMSKEDFFKWLMSRGIDEEDCKTLSSK